MATEINTEALNLRPEGDGNPGSNGDTESDTNKDAENAKNTIQHSASADDKYIRRNTKSYKDLSYFIGGIDVTQQNLDQMTPYIPGISRLFFHTTPLFMQEGFKDLTDNFKSHIETGYKSVSGIEGLQADFVQISGGFAEQSFENISKITDGSNAISVTLYEQTGSPVREFIETWLTGVRDPRSGIAHYHGLVKKPDGTGSVEYAEKNHTGEFIFYDLDPTAHYLEYACMWAHCFPKGIDKQHLNYQSGSRDVVELSLEFSGTKYESRYINDIAIYYLTQEQLDFNYLNFNPNLDGVYKNATGNAATNYDLHLTDKSSGTVAKPENITPNAQT